MPPEPPDGRARPPRVSAVRPFITCWEAAVGDTVKDDREADRGRVRPQALVFDVNETLSDMAPLAQRCVDVGAPDHLAATWFASVLRDGFALTAAGVRPAFADIAQDLLRSSLAGTVTNPEGAAAHIMTGFTELPVHADVAPGIRGLTRLGVRLFTLSNGSASVADALLERCGIRAEFEQLLSVDDAPLWKPAKVAYGHARTVSGLSADQLMLVAVHPWDIDGAHRAGLATAWIDRGCGRYPGHFAPPDLRVSSVVDLAGRLAEMPARTA